MNLDLNSAGHSAPVLDYSCGTTNIPAIQGPNGVQVSLEATEE